MKRGRYEKYKRSSRKVCVCINGKGGKVNFKTRALGV